MTFEQKFKKVFSYVFSDTLIVDDISVATVQGLERPKFVTLDGDAAEVSGAMHGGFRKRKKRHLASRKERLRKILKSTKRKLESLKMSYRCLRKEEMKMKQKSQS